MKIDIYSKAGCQKCDAAKSNLSSRGIEYTAHDVEYHIAHHDNWRDDGSVELLTEYAMGDGQLPLIRVDGVVYSHTKGMKVIKEMIEAEKKKAVVEQP